MSLLNLGALLIVYDKDPEIQEIPNFAERQRASSVEFSQWLVSNLIPMNSKKFEFKDFN